MQFEEWVRVVFWQPLGEPADEAEWELFAMARPDLKPAMSVAYMTQLFEHADILLQSLSDAQVAQGLDWVIQNEVFSLREEAVPVADRVRAILAMQTLFANCFANRCPRLLRETNNPLNINCQIWWDLLPIHWLVQHQPERSDSAAIDRACLDALKGILEIDAPSCQNSALYGLQMWFHCYPETRTIIDDFLKRHTNLRPEILQYAMLARNGFRDYPIRLPKKG